MSGCISGGTLTVRPRHDSISVAVWSGGKKSAFSFTFDDATLDHNKYVRPILAEYDFKATFYVNTHLVGSGWNYGSWDDFAEILAAGHELGSHSATHQHMAGLAPGSETQSRTILHELAASKVEIERRFPGSRCLTFAYPYCETSSALATLVGRYYLAARTCGVDSSSPAWNAASPADWMRLASYGPVFPKTRTSPRDDRAELEKAERMLSRSIEQGKWAIFMIHMVLPFAEINSNSGWEPISTEWFGELCDWLTPKAEGAEIWIDTAANITKYVRERDAYWIEGFSGTEGEISFSVCDDLPGEIFDFPLTLEVKVPGDWNAARISASSGEAEIPIEASPAGKRVRFEAIPGRGVIKLIRS